MDNTHTASNDGAAPQGERYKLLAWRWLIAALAVLVAATYVALNQTRAPVPPDRAPPAFSFWHPLEGNPHRRLPRVREDLNALYFAADGKRGWAVGSAGRILATRDGGASWTAQDSGENRTLELVVFDADGQRGWAGGEGGVYRITVNGGKTWLPSNQSWDALPAGVGTERRGRRQPVVPAPGERGETAIDMSSLMTTATFRLDQRTAWRVQGSPGIIERTDDGGDSWRPVANTRRFELDAIHMAPDGVRGWAAGRDGAIIATTDSWRTWHPLTAGAQATLLDVWLGPDGKHAWAVGASGIIFASTDGGRSWRRQASGVHTVLSSVRFDRDNLHGLAGGENELIATNNGGARWERVDRHGAGDIAGLHVWDKGRRGRVFGRQGVGAELGADGRWHRLESASADFVPRSPTLDASGRFGWAINDPFLKGFWSRQGELIRTTDGGTNWTRVPTEVKLTDISIAPDGLTGFGVISALQVDAGKSARVAVYNVLATTRDAGRSWTPNRSPIARGLAAVRTSPDARHALAVGGAGVILRTEDGGKTWRHAEQYSWLPAPWYWIAVALSAGMVWTAWTRRPLQARLTVASMAASDAEVRAFDQDRLNFGGLARGISRFLRNAETQPPLTLAITGAWGTGKSSLMRLVCADMRRFKHRPIWFNAWHHQKEEHLFAALLGAIYTQAAPPLLSLGGVRFRLRLLWLRSRRHFGVVLLLLVGISAACGFGWNVLMNGGLDNLTASVHALTKDAAPLAGAASGFFAAATALTLLIKGATPLRINPAILLGATREHLSLKHAAAQNDFRERFARQFGEVTRALSSKLVIIIDDLDRCHPSAVIEVMETVNYLTSAGQCFIMFGMDKERVIAALGLAFKDIAAELVQMERGPGDPAPDNAAVAERELAKRRTYATDYLQKLVNVEIKVPTAPDQQHRLLLREAAPGITGLQRAIRHIASIAPVAACAAAILVGAGIVHLGQGAEPSTARQVAVEAASPAAPSSPAPQAGAVLPPAQPDAGLQAAAPSMQQAVEPGEQNTAAASWRWIGAAILLLLVIGALVAIQALRQSLVTTHDSLEFQEALLIWLPYVAFFRPTPRAIKRFCNRLRYLAMLQQGEEGDKTVLDLLQERVRRWRTRRDGTGAGQPAHTDALSEQQLIALGAMYEVFGEQWKSMMTSLFPGDWRSASPPNAQLAPEGKILETAAMAHRARFGVAWPPTTAEIAVFDRLIAGVRLAGDPRPIKPDRTERETSGTDPYGDSPAAFSQAASTEAAVSRPSFDPAEESSRGSSSQTGRNTTRHSQTSANHGKNTAKR